MKNKNTFSGSKFRITEAQVQALVCYWKMKGFDVSIIRPYGKHYYSFRMNGANFNWGFGYGEDQKGSVTVMLAKRIDEKYFLLRIYTHMKSDKLKDIAQDIVGMIK